MVLLGNGSITNWLPTDTNEVDLGSSTKEMKDIYVDGVAYTDAIGFGTVAMTLPTADGSANQVLKTDGSGALGWATVSGGGGSLAQLTENSKTGYRLSEADANNYGEIGASAVDLSISSTASSTKGATGTNSFATNISTASGTQSFAAGSSFASGTQSTAFGYNNNSPGQFSFATGQGSYSYGARSTTLGMANEARGTLSVTTGKYTVARDYGTLVIGQYNSVGNLAVTSNGSGTVFDTDNSALVIGNGEIGSLSDAFVVYSNGNTTTSGDLSLGGSNKELRFYEGANYVGFEAPALSADKIWVLPAADGSANQVLKTDGSGALGWATVSGVVPTYSVGTYYAELGGWVVSVNSTGTHGLVISGQQLGTVTMDVSPEHNISDIVNNANELISNPGNYNSDGQEFYDWRVPTFHEMKNIVGAAYFNSSLTSFYKLAALDYAYWTSKPGNGTNSWSIVDLDASGSLYSGSSSGTQYVIAVRAF